ncbi:ABC transporter ATP-binding protein [Pseudobacteriovorax antillogorgiicola]|uniref:Iron(III) transport system ATP-binding protein n=1 Tax=Pseudobacteriovorax antillogorgiicola TaxID=1513793 RepID=A0A1Y6CKF3_9BACT|nr:ABC transporter ATP-binding protein [Pseudobacteriovorax antillogorgiicola]TCS47683.1 iron(III) transport system ATP-binding protein [Pseudobacteriovorax antillogorgiicola]SMF59575.1 iron(III) transport system ATP-binding protein [Pseudobacteriovorax antillogorgiicola]
MSRVVLKVEDLIHRYGSQATLNQINLELTEGMVGCLLGASGCGKTTLLRCIAGFEPVLGGCITLNQRIVSSDSRFIPPEKRRIGVVFQDYALFPHLTVAENIGFGIRHMSKADQVEKVDKLLASVDLTAHAHKYPSELSGGQQQRVALARALAPEPDLLLLDEPFSNLDSNLRERMKHELKTLLEHFGVTALLVTHNQDEAFDIADEIGVMSGGKILQWGSSYDLYHKPQSREVASFLGMSAFLPAKVSHDGCVLTELGEVVCKEDLKTLKGKNITVLLRPDDIIHDDQIAPIATVEQVSFRGMFLVYHLRLPSGQLIHCFTSSHHEKHEIGGKIGIRLDMKHAVILREDEALVEQVDESTMPKRHG